MPRGPHTTSHAYDFKDHQPKKPPKELHHLRLIPAENGGHIIEHHFAEEPHMTEHKPESHSFGAEDGDKTLLHLAEHGHIKHPSDGDGAPAAEGEEGEDY